MKFVRIAQLPLICLLIVSLLASAASASGYVWCVTSDGHSALEAAFAGDCAADLRAAATEDCANSTQSFAVDDGCGHCLDVSTAHHWGAPRTRQVDLPAGVPANILPAIGVSAVPLPRSLDTHRRLDQSQRLSEPILHHRTIVLLI